MATPPNYIKVVVEKDTLNQRDTLEHRKYLTKEINTSSFLFLAATGNQLSGDKENV
jgi:hypothetical protein